MPQKRIKTQPSARRKKMRDMFLAFALVYPAFQLRLQRDFFQVRFIISRNVHLFLNGLSTSLQVPFILLSLCTCNLSADWFELKWSMYIQAKDESYALLMVLSQRHRNFTTYSCDFRTKIWYLDPLFPDTTTLPTGVRLSRFFLEQRSSRPLLDNGPLIFSAGLQ